MRAILRGLALLAILVFIGTGYLAFSVFGLPPLTSSPAASALPTDPVHIGTGGHQLDYARLATGPDGKPSAYRPVKYDYVPGDLIMKFNTPAGEEIRAQLEGGASFVELRFPEQVAALNTKYGARAMRPLFQQDVSPSALAEARVRALRERAQRRHLPEPRIMPVKLPRLDLIFVLQIAKTADAIAAAREYGQASGIDFAEPNAIARTSAEQFASYQWPLSTMNLPVSGFDGTGLVVAVVDSGVAFCHPDLADRVIAVLETGPNHCDGSDNNGNGIVDESKGYDAFTPGTDSVSPSFPLVPPDDPLGHGTHVAGIIAATINGTGIAGVAPGATIVPVRVFRSDGTGDIVTIANGYSWAINSSPTPDVINNSWGAPRIFAGATLDLLTQTAHDGFGILVVSAAGNDQTNTCGFLPTGSEYGMSVSASTHNAPEQLAYYSNYGVKIDVAAPGGQPPSPVLSTVPSTHTLVTGPDLLDSLPPTPPYQPGHYNSLAGTSMAAPHVTGLAVLLMQQHPAYTVDEIQQLIRQTAAPVQGNGFFSTPVNVLVGYGRADAVGTGPLPTPPAASIVDPFNCGLVESQINISGFALPNQGSFQSYSLGVTPETIPFLLTPFQNSPYSTLSIIPSTSSLPVGPVAGPLASWDTVSVADGTYVIKLDVEDSAGHSQDYNEVTVDNVYLTHPYPYEIFDLRPDLQSVYEVLRFWSPGSPPTGHGPLTHSPHAIPINGVINDRSQSTSAYLYKWKLGVADGENVDCSTTTYPDSSTPTPPYTTLNSDQLLPGATPYTTAPTKRYLLPPATLANWDVTPTTVTDGFHTFCLIAYYTNDNTVTTFQTDHVSTGALTVILDRYIAQNFPVDVVQRDALGVSSQEYNGHPLTLKSPKIADLDHDGKKEIVFGSMVYEADGTTRPGWAGRTPGYGGSNPAIVNLDNNPKLEVVAGDVTNWSGPAVVTAYHANGGVMWTYMVPQSGTAPLRISSIVAGNLIPNHGIDIVFTVTTGLYGDPGSYTTLYVLRGSNGALLASKTPYFAGTGTSMGPSWSAPALGKLEPLQNTEIAVHTTSALLVYRLVTSTTTASGYDLSFITGNADTTIFPSDARADPVFSDVFNPGVAPNQQEIVLGNDVFERQPNGNLVATPFATPATAMGTAYPRTVPWWFINIPLVYFGNGSNVMSASTPWVGNSTVSMLADTTLTDNDFMLQNKPAGPFLRDNQLQGNPIVGDLDGDGQGDMLRTSNADRILGYMGYGPWPTPYPTKLYANKLSTANSPLFPFPRYVWERTYVDRSSAAIDDVDCDHKTDVLIAAGGLLYMWKTNAPFVAANNAWPMYQHDVRNTGNASTVLSNVAAGACP